MPTTTTIPTGLEVKRWGDGWYISHTASRLPLHQVAYVTKKEAVAGAERVGGLPVDWTADKDTVRAACEQLDGGMTAVRRLATPPAEIARLRRAALNGVRYLRALEEDGATVVGRTSHGLAGTVYEMSCGCHRHFSVTIGGMGAGEAREDLLVRCDRHRDLVVAEA